MGMTLPKPNDTNFEIPPAGTFMAVCYRVIDLGTQDGSWQGKPKKQHKILISWEMPDEKMSDGRPFTISSRYTWSMSEKAALRKDLESWRGKPFGDADFGEDGFAIKNIIGKPCLLTVVHTTKNGKTYANIKGIAGLMKGMTAPERIENETVFLGLNEDDWKRDVFYKLSDNIQNTIKSSPEYAEIVGGHVPDEGPVVERDRHELEDAIPF